MDRLTDSDRWRRIATLLASGTLLLAISSARADERKPEAFPRLATLTVNLKRPSGFTKPLPNDCAEWPSCAEPAPNAELIMTFDESSPGARKLANTFSIDIGGHAPVQVHRAAGGAYHGDFCLDAPAFCRSQGGPNFDPDREHAWTEFKGREVSKQTQEPAVNLVALWKGAQVTLDPKNLSSDMIDPHRSLVITHKDVTQNKDRTFTPCGRENDDEGLHPYGNPDGKWTFGRLMKALAGKTDPKTFLKSWILLVDPRPSTTVNTFPISPRPRLREKLLKPWCGKVTGNIAGCDPEHDNTLDITPETAPFRLLAIVNRIDLADVFLQDPKEIPEDEPRRAGELRFVFAAQTWNDCLVDQQFFVILEYEVMKSKCDDLTNWAKQWVALSGLTGTAYLDALDALVESVVAAPSGLVRLRTNDGYSPFEGSPQEKIPWMMRQFDWYDGKPKDKDSKFVATALNRTPDVSFQVEPGLSKLKTWIADHQADIDLDKHEFKDDALDDGTPVAGGQGPLSPDHDGRRGPIWKVPGADTTTHPDLQHHFSLNACPSCHGGETRTNVAHIQSDGIFGPVFLSKFLEGGCPIPDPRGQDDSTGFPVERSFDDLTRRKQILACIANGFETPCLCQSMLQRISTPH